MDDAPPPVDGMSAPDEPAAAASASGAVQNSQYGQNVERELELQKRAKVVLLIGFGIPYVMFLGWCGLLITLLPSQTGQSDFLIFPGTVSALTGSAVLFLIALIGLKRILEHKRLPMPTKIMSALRLTGVVTPGLAAGLIVPLIISAEPPFNIKVTDPIDPTAFVAPLAVTFSLEDAVDVLGRRGLRPISYGWDFDGDGQKNDQTLEPVATAVYDRAGVYNVVARIDVSDGSMRRVVFPLSIPRAVFAVSPLRPIVDEPVTFTVEHLVDDQVGLREVQWDFDGDGVTDEVTDEAEISHIFLRTGAVNVSALVVFMNQTQLRFEKEVMISDPPPLPFDVKILTEPEYLISPAPFGTKFRVETEEPLRDVKWNFGDGEEDNGVAVGHTFRKEGEFVVTARVRSEEGDIANVTKIVRVVPKLQLPDIAFNGTPEVDTLTNTIAGEIPLSLNLTPRTSQPLIEFFWEAPDATAVGSTDTTLQAIYRRPGTYIVTLLAQDPEGRALRMPITVEVLPPSSSIVIHMTPEGGVAPLNVRFDASETNIPGEDITGFEWLFGDITGQNVKPQQGGAAVEHMYFKPGTYTITLYARTTKGNVYQESKTIVVRAPLLDACFTASRLNGKAPLGVKFNMSCTAGVPVGIEWDFGDDTTSDLEDPVHVFEDPGKYRVTLKLTDEVGSVSTKMVEITAE